MKKLDLNIELIEPIKRQVEDGVDDKGKPKFREEVVPAYDVSLQWIGVMIERAINKPRPDMRTGRLIPTVEVTMAVQRKYNKVMDALEAHKDGIAEVEDDDFSFLDSKFHQAEMSVQRDVNKILVSIDDRILKAKIPPKTQEKEEAK